MLHAGPAVLSAFSLGVWHDAKSRDENNHSSAKSHAEAGIPISVLACSVRVDGYTDSSVICFNERTEHDALKVML